MKTIENEPKKVSTQSSKMIGPRAIRALTGLESTGAPDFMARWISDVTDELVWLVDYTRVFDHENCGQGYGADRFLIRDEDEKYTLVEIKYDWQTRGNSWGTADHCVSISSITKSAESVDTDKDVEGIMTA